MPYTSAYPPIPFDPAYKSFFENFYAISDDPDAHGKYVEQFTHNATLIMASRRAVGAEEILALRKSLWDKVSHRSHTPTHVFPYGPDSHDAMLRGRVEYQLKTGGKSGVDWAAYAKFVKVDGTVRMEFYQVYLDTAAQG